MPASRRKLVLPPPRLPPRLPRTSPATNPPTDPMKGPRVPYPALLVDVTIFVLSLWVGFEVISKVPATLHTPLMSAANSIHGIVLAGAMLIAVTAHNAGGYVLAFVACAVAAAHRGG